MLKEKSKIKFNALLIAAFFFGAAWFSYPKNRTPQHDLSRTKVTMSSKAEEMNQGRVSSYYRFQTKQTQAAFVIRTPGANLMGGAIDSLKNGDSLVIEYKHRHDIELQDPSVEIPVYYVEKAGKVYFNPTTFQQEDNFIDLRWTFVESAIGFIFLLNGLTRVRAVINWLIVAATIIGLFTMHHFIGFLLR